MTGTTRKKPLCRKRSMWNARPHKEVYLASVGGRSVPKFFLRGKAGTILGKRLPSKGNDRPAGTGRVVINVPD